MIMPYLGDMINDHKTPETQSEKWKIQISIRVNFISSKDTEETCIVYKWIILEILDNIRRLFESFLDNYQKEKQIMRGGSDFIFESVELMDYKLHKASLKRVKSYIESPEWLVNKRATIQQ